MSQSARGPAEAKPETSLSARAKEDKPQLSARQQSARDEAKPQQSARIADGPTITARVAAMDTSRDYMSTARMHTALSALTAERAELLNKLAFIDSTLEAEGKKKLMRTRGFMAPMGK